MTAGGGRAGDADRPTAPEAPPAEAPADGDPAAPPRPAVAACSFWSNALRASALRLSASALALPGAALR